MAENKSWGLIAVAAVPAVVIGGVLSILLVGGGDMEVTATSGCSPTSGTVTAPIALPDPLPSATDGFIQIPDPAPGPAIEVPDEIAGYGPEQLRNAAYVIKAAQDLQLNVRDQTIGVMTAMGESSLKVLDRGDAVGPDSRGLFQQRAVGWGSYEDRMDPYISSTNFFNAMVKKVPERETLAPTLVAHKTQVNADPFHYEKYWDPAVEVVEGLAGIDTGLLGTGGQACSSGPSLPGEVSATGWANPGNGPINSSYGWRMHPTLKVWKLHAGVDLQAGGCNGPIWAAQDGVVTFSGFDTVGNGTITIDHGGGLRTSYLHMYQNGLLAKVGQQVQAGEQIARVGSSGRSSGCHLHFEVIVNGDQVDPVPYLSSVGVTLS
jgi:murein DD-endopeptidase MepM/ murein hydrolase activator NlpD